MKKIMIISLALTLAACSDEKAATNALDNLGMKNIKTDGYPFFNDCGEKYAYATKFEASNPNGKRVSGVVCSTLYGTSTVKFY